MGIDFLNEYKIKMQPTILVLKEGTENAQGTEQVVSNINACSAIVDAIRTTLGPRGMDKAAAMAVNQVKELAVSIPENERRSQLVKCAATAMSSKLIHQQKDLFSNMVVDAVCLLDEVVLPLNMIGIK